jgi:hypothetical protein
VSFTAPKTWSPGEVLTSSDMNTYVRDNTQALFDLPEFIAAPTNSVNIDFTTSKIITRPATGTITFSGSNYTAGKSALVRIVTDSSARSLSFPSGWRFISAKPTQQNSFKVGLLSVVSFGTTEADCVASWAVES